MTTSYHRIPQLKFPTNDDGITPLMQDVRQYSVDAIRNPMKAWLDGSEVDSSVPHLFDVNQSFTPSCKPDNPSIDIEGTPISNTSDYLKVVSLKNGGNCSFGIQWTQFANNQGVFPQYFKSDKSGNTAVALSADALPDFARGLKTASFEIAQAGTTNDSKRSFKPNKLGPYKARLSDGSVVTYYWYKFSEQPAFDHLKLDQQQKNRLQAMAEKIQTYWSKDKNYIPPPSSGQLVSLDRHI